MLRKKISKEPTKPCEQPGHTGSKAIIIPKVETTSKLPVFVKADQPKLNVFDK